MRVGTTCDKKAVVIIKFLATSLKENSIGNRVFF